MRRVTVTAVAALCLMGTSSLALAEEGAKYGDQIETGQLSQEPSVLGMKREPVRADDAMKREPVQGYDATPDMKVPKRTYSGEGAKYGDQINTGQLSQEPSVLGMKREPVRADDAMKREPVQGYDATPDMKVPKRTYSGEGAKYGDQIETGQLSQEPSVLGMKREPVRADDAMKGKEKEHKEKMKTHKDTAKAAPAAPAPADKP
jgi:hypothetical protein